MKTFKEWVLQKENAGELTPSEQKLGEFLNNNLLSILQSCLPTKYKSTNFTLTDFCDPIEYGDDNYSYGYSWRTMFPMQEGEYDSMYTSVDQEEIEEYGSQEAAIKAGMISAIGEGAVHSPVRQCFSTFSMTNSPVAHNAIRQSLQSAGFQVLDLDMDTDRDSYTELKENGMVYEECSVGIVVVAKI